MLTAVYDLQCSPPTYDFVSFLLRIEMVRRRLGEETMQIIIFRSGPVGGFRNDKLWPRPVNERAELVERIIKPLATLLPSVIAVKEDLGPLVCPLPMVGVDAVLFGLWHFVDSWREVGPVLRADVPKRPGLVTITLRESEHWEERNSDLPQWIAAATMIRAMGYHVVFVRDTCKADELLDDFSTAPTASWDARARAELYAAADCNMFVGNGPAWLSFALNAPTIMFRPMGRAGTIHGVASFERAGLPKGSQLPGSGAHQRIVWQMDTADVIMSAFRAFVATNESRAA